MAYPTKNYTMGELLTMANDRRISRAELLTEIYGTLPHPAGYNPGGGFADRQLHMERMVAHGIDRNMARFIAFGDVERPNTGKRVQNPNAHHLGRNAARATTYPPIPTTRAQAIEMNDAARNQQAIEMSIAQTKGEMARRRTVRAAPIPPNQRRVVPGGHRLSSSALEFIPSQVLSSWVSGGPSRNGVRPPPLNPAAPPFSTLNTSNSAPAARAASPTSDNTATTPLSEVPSLTSSPSSTPPESPVPTTPSSPLTPPKTTTANPTLPFYPFGPVPTPASQPVSSHPFAFAFAPRHGPGFPRTAPTPYTTLQVRNAPNSGQALIREQTRQQDEWADIAADIREEEARQAALIREQTRHLNSWAEIETGILEEARRQDEWAADFEAENMAEPARLARLIAGEQRRRLDRLRSEAAERGHSGEACW